MAFQKANETWLVQKWGRDVLAMIGMLASGNIIDPLVPEVDWYPWFDRGEEKKQTAEPTARAWSHLEHGKAMLSMPEAYVWLTQTVAEERRRLGRPPMCVELGAWCGASAMALTEGGAYVMSVDTFRGSDQFTGKETLERLGQGRGSTFDLFVKNVFNFGYAGRVLPVVATSLEAAQLFALAGAYIDVLYHDADHDKVAVLADLAAWWPVISPGGIVIGHDWNLVGQGVQAISQIVGMLPVSSGEICPDHTWMLRKG